MFSYDGNMRLLIYFLTSNAIKQNYITAQIYSH